MVNLWRGLRILYPRYDTLLEDLDCSLVAQADLFVEAGNHYSDAALQGASAIIVQYFQVGM